MGDIINNGLHIGDNTQTNYYGPIPRNMDNSYAFKKQIDDLVASKQGATFTICAIMGDGEAFNFAKQILQYFQTKPGIVVKGVDQVLMSEPVIGVEFNPETNQLTVGANIK